MDELSKQLLSAHNTTTDLAVFILPDGTSADDLIGAEIQQLFPGHGTF